MDDQKFVNDVIQKLNGKISDDAIKIVMDQIRMSMSNYTINAKKEELIVQEGLPQEYQIFLVSKKIEGRSLGTLEQYKMCIESMLSAVQKPLSQITSNDIRLYLYHLQFTHNLSDRTLDCRRLIINVFMKWCCEEGYISSNPCESIRRIHYESKPRVPLSDTQMEQVRNACINLRDKAVIETLYSTGCRCSELANLLIEDVDIDGRQVKLFGKGKKHRLSYLSARATVAINEYLANRNDENPYLIVSKKKPFDKLGNGGIECIVRDIARRAGVENVYPHRIRHTFATDALDRGMDIQDLQSILGHSSTDTTLIYAKLNPAQISHSHKRCIV